MISIINILKGSNEQNAGLNYLPNSRVIGSVGISKGKFYLIAFSLKTSTQNMPVLMSINAEDGLVVTPIVYTIINTATPLSPNYPQLTNVYKSISVYLYGGYCVSSNPNWDLTVTFGRCDFSSFAFSIDEVMGCTSSPIIQSSSSKTNSTILNNITPGNMTYLIGMSMLQNESYPMNINPQSIQISRCFDESIVPNLISGYNSVGDINLGWSNGSEYPWLEKSTLACEIASA